MGVKTIECMWGDKTLAEQEMGIFRRRESCDYRFGNKGERKYYIFLLFLCYSNLSFVSGG